MKKLLYIFMLTISSALALSSCREEIDDWAEDMFRYNVANYIHNETSQDVTVTFPDKKSYLVHRGRAVQIPHSEYLNISNRYRETDSVVFRFADGTRIVHTYTNTAYGQDGMYKFAYSPERNNIFYTGYDVTTREDSWVKSRVSSKKYRLDYTIR